MISPVLSRNKKGFQPEEVPAVLHVRSDLFVIARTDATDMEDGFKRAVKYAQAGGGTLISFPVLVALGLPAVAANVTNTVALCPGYLGATMAQSGDLKGQRRRLMLCLPAAVLGGVAGGVLLLCTSERLFQSLVPFLILSATLRGVVVGVGLLVAAAYFWKIWLR